MPSFSSMNEESALSIIDWRYSAPYDCYNFSADSIQADLQHLLDLENAFFTILNDTEELEGYCSFGSDGRVLGGDYRTDALDIGMGIRPDLTGQGLGKFYAESVVQHGMSQYGARRLRVTIASFNQRAQRVWIDLGFRPVQRFVKLGGRAKFVIMIRSVI